jgi:hypothetical protein
MIGKMRDEMEARTVEGLRIAAIKYEKKMMTRINTFAN